MKEHLFQRGQRVWKPKGYPFPGIVQAVFRTSTGKFRVVVEFVGADGLPTELLHIFAPEQLLPAEDPRRDPDVEVRMVSNAVLVRQGRKPEDQP